MSTSTMHALPDFAVQERIGREPILVMLNQTSRYYTVSPVQLPLVLLYNSINDAAKDSNLVVSHGMPGLYGGLYRLNSTAKQWLYKQANIIVRER